MGWSFFQPGFDRDDMIAHLRKSYAWGDRVVIKSQVTGGVEFWALVRQSDGSYYVAISLIQGGGKTHGWGHKELSHTDSVGCPVSYLEYLPESSDADELAWREKVRKHHRKQAQLAAARKALKPGDKLELAGHTYELLESLGSRGWKVRRVRDCEIMRMPAAHVGQAVRKAWKAKEEGNAPT